MAWVLVVAFLLQPVLAYLVTPLVTHDAEGMQVVICTLEGERIVDLALPAPADADDADPCSALQLFQLAGSVQISEPPTMPAAFLYAVALLDQTARHSHHRLHFSAYSTRAPPIS